MQKASQITVDGHYGEQRHSALMGLAADLNPDTDQPEEKPRLLRVNGGCVNVCSGQWRDRLDFRKYASVME